MPSHFTPSFPSTATVHTMFFRFESALMNPATIVLSTRLGFPRKCLKSSLFYHYLYWIDQKSIIRSLVIFSESLLTVVVAPCELTVSDEAKKKDKDYRSTLVKAKVRAIISCEECKKPRCIYANSRLTSQEEVCVKRMKEAKTYICGSPLFPDGSPLGCTVLVREALLCGSPIDSVLYFCVGAFSSSLFLLRFRRRDPC